MQQTNLIYNLTKEDCVKLLSHVNNDLGSLALLLWNKGKVKRIKDGIECAQRIKNYVNQTV